MTNVYFDLSIFSLKLYSLTICDYNIYIYICIYFSKVYFTMRESSFIYLRTLFILELAQNRSFFIDTTLKIFQCNKWVTEIVCHAVVVHSGKIRSILCLINSRIISEWTGQHINIDSSRFSRHGFSLFFRGQARKRALFARRFDATYSRCDYANEYKK